MSYQSRLKAFERILLNSNLLTPRQFSDVLERSRAANEDFHESLCRLGHFDDAVHDLFELKVGFPFVDVRDYPIDEAAMAWVPESYMIEAPCLPFADDGRELSVAFADPTNSSSVIAYVESITKRKLRAYATCSGFFPELIPELFIDDTDFTTVFTECPACGSGHLATILYGLPSSEALDAAQEGALVLGGCSYIRSSPLWYCKSCQHQW